MTTLLVDIDTNRIIYFDRDNKDLIEDSGSARAVYEGNPPPSMTLENCWDYKLIDQKIVVPKPPSPSSHALPQLELNRRSSIDFVERSVINYLLERSPATIQDLVVVMAQPDELAKATAVILHGRKVKTDYTEKLELAGTVEELLRLRQECLKELTDGFPAQTLA